MPIRTEFAGLVVAFWQAHPRAQGNGHKASRTYFLWEACSKSPRGGWRYSRVRQCKESLTLVSVVGDIKFF